MIHTKQAASLESGDYVEFLRAGQTAVGEYRCSGCGYGAVVRRELPPCPMCGGEVWEPSEWSPLTRARKQSS
jgi:rubrerythrin